MTADNDGMILGLALNYSGRVKIEDIVKKIVLEFKDGKIGYEDISQRCISQHIYAPQIGETDLWTLLFLPSRKLRNIPFSLHLPACRRMIRRIHVNRSLAVWLLHYTWFVPLLSGSLCLQAGPGGQGNSGWPLAQDMPPEVPAVVTKTRLARLRPRFCPPWYLPEKSSSGGRKA